MEDHHHIIESPMVDGIDVNKFNTLLLQYIKIKYSIKKFYKNMLNKDEIYD